MGSDLQIRDYPGHSGTVDTYVYPSITANEKVQVVQYRTTNGVRAAVGHFSDDLDSFLDLPS